MASELSQLLEQEARVEQEQVRTEARAKADEILAAARREADEILAVATRRAEDEQVQARARATSTASLRAAALVLVAKDGAIRAVFEQAEAELRSAAADAGRRGVILRSLLREATRGLAPSRSGARAYGAASTHVNQDVPPLRGQADGGGAPTGHRQAGGRAVVEAAPGDAQAVREACRELGLDAEVRETSEVAGGIRLVSPDGRSIVENTVPSRLARARREMVSRVAEILWRDG